jgi:K+-transporting ATPase ATPase A chain
VTEAASTTTQTLAMGPVASQEAIKMLGTNGGGFFNANSAHPFENPTPLVNFLQMLSIFLIPGALCIAFGCIVGDERQGWTVFAAMALLFVSFAIGAISFEQQGNPLLAQVGETEATGVRTTALTDGNMEGKESALRYRRFGPFCDDHHGRVLRCGQCDARLVHAARRCRATGDDATR